MGGDVHGVGVIPLIPLVIGGAAAVGGLIGYNIGSPKYDKNGNPLPSLAQTATKEISTGISRAITFAAIAGIGYMIFLDSSKRKARR